MVPRARRSGDRQAIDRYCYLTCRYLPPFFEHRFRIVYSKAENVETVEQINHPAVREILRYPEG